MRETFLASFGGSFGPYATPPVIAVLPVSPVEVPVVTLFEVSIWVDVLPKLSFCYFAPSVLLIDVIAPPEFLRIPFLFSDSVLTS